MVKKDKLLILILILAAFLRIFWLDRVPPELFGDEVDVGYQAYSLLKTGRDYKGNLLPAYMDSLAEPRAPFLMYATVPFLAIFGLNEWGVRLPSAFFGILSVWLLYALMKELWDDDRAALAGAFLLAITPWHLLYSRAAFEVSLLLFLILLGTLFFLKGAKGRAIWLVGSIVAFSLTFYTYNTANVFVPLWGLALLLTYRRMLLAKWSKAFAKLGALAVLGLLLVSPLVFQIFFGSAAFRFGLVSIFSDSHLVDEIIIKRSAAAPASLIERIFHNKPLYWARGVADNYFEAFSLKFLFVSGDPNPRHCLPGFGLLLVGMLPLLLAGLWQRKRLVLVWLLLSPIPSSLTSDGNNHATRLILMLPPLLILAGLGASWFRKRKKGNLLVPALGLFLVLELSVYLHEATFHYPKEQYRHWHYGYSRAIELYRENQALCQRLYLNNSHEPFLVRYLFWTGTDPGWFQANHLLDKENQIVEGVFLSYRLGESFFGRIVVPGKLEAVKKLLAYPQSCFLAFQGDEIPGDWDFEKSPPKGIKVLGTVKDPLENNFIYLLTADE